MPKTAAVQQAAVQQAIESYTWSFPGSPVRIHLRLDVVERLRAEVTRAFGASSEIEIGGLLIGRAESPAAIEVSDFQPAAPVDSGVLSSDWPSLRNRQASDAGGLAVIGYYRSHLGEELNLNEDDLAVFRAHFAKPTDVCLLIKPLADGSCTAGFFFWDNGIIESGFSFNEFPFDPERLRLESLDQRAGRTRPDPEPQPEPVRKPAARRSSPPLLPLLGVCALAGGLGLGYAMWGRGNERWTQLDGDSINGSATQLDLRIHSQGDDLRLTWNRDAPVLKSGSIRGTLTIQDGDWLKREIPLGAEELLTTGNIVYSPLSNKVRFRLAIVSAAEQMAESAFSVKGGRDPLPAPAPPPARQPETAEQAPAPRASRTVKAFIPPEPVRPNPVRPENAEPPVVSMVANQPAAMPWTVSFNVAPPPGRNVPTDRSTIGSALSPEPAPPAAEPARDVYTAPKAIRQAKPVVPAPSRILVRNDGEVKVNVHIDAAGKVTRADVVESTVPVLTGSAISAARLWRFEPARRNGQKVESNAVLVFRFRGSQGTN